MAIRSYAIHVTASFNGQTVEECLMARGVSVTLDEYGPMALPVPDGWPYVAKMDWMRPGELRVIDGKGEMYVATTEGSVELEHESIHLEIRVVRQFRYQRLPSFAAAMSSLAGLFIIGQLILSLGLVSGQGVQSCEVYCSTWLGHYTQVSAREWSQKPLLFTDRLCQCPGPPDQAGAASGTIQDVTAEYLERILQNDLDGYDDGSLVRKERETGDRPNESFYLPAGDKGPANKMGGAEETALTPQREYSEEETVASPKKSKELLANDDVGTPVDLPGEASDADDEGEEESDAVAEEMNPAAEEEEGWGIRDWYDAEDKVRDDMEVEAMTRLAKRILKINPNDPEALSILSYYQYLSEDYEQAKETYDKYINVIPEDPAGYNNKALIYKRLKQYDEEERLYRVALSLEGDDTTALNNLAVNLGHQGRIDEALQIMKELEVRTPDDPYADLHRAKIYAEAKELDKAYLYLEKALEGMRVLDTLHHIEFRQDIRLDPSFAVIRKQERFRALMWRFYGTDAPVVEP